MKINTLMQTRYLAKEDKAKLIILISSLLKSIRTLGGTERVCCLR